MDPVNTLTLADFIQRFYELKRRGWVRSLRSGPTGIGKTLEELLGIEENNIAVPDLGSIELKAHRIHSNSMITLFTFNRKVWKMRPLEAIRRYGTPDKNERLGLYYTMSRTPNSSGLFLYDERESVSVRHVSGEIIAEWNLEQLAERFIKKLPAVIFVSACSEMRGDVEWFNYTRAQLLTGTSADIIHSQILSGNIQIDLRLHDKVTSARNHGTGFRIFEAKLPLLFQVIRDL